MESTELEGQRSLPEDAHLPAKWPVSGTISFEAKGVEHVAKG